jgi:hypothetical protein
MATIQPGGRGTVGFEIADVRYRGRTGGGQGEDRGRTGGQTSCDIYSQREVGQAASSAPGDAI